MQDKVQHSTSDDKILIELMTNRFTQDLVHVIKNTYPYTMLFEYKTVELNLRQVKMIDSSSIGFLFELHNKLLSNNTNLIVSAGDNAELRDLLHKFQVDLLLHIQ